MSSLGLIDSFKHRLEIVEEIEILTSSNLLQRYNHVWNNSHWFEGIQTIYPLNDEDEKENENEIRREMNNRIKSCLSNKCLMGIKIMQESLLLYKLESPEFIGSITSMNVIHNQSSSLIESVAMIDISSRLLTAAQHSRMMMTDLQAVFETKSLFAFLSPNEICLLRSPRTLRTALWELGLSFSSVFGHSSDKNPNVNLDRYDMDTVSDPRSNFPGCIKWKKLIDSSGLNSKSKATLDRMRDFLFFDGPNEVIPFLKLILHDLKQIPLDTISILSLNDHSIQTLSSNVTNSYNYKAVHNKQHTNVSSLFESLGVQRLLANFPFRGAQLSIPTVQWNTSISNDRYSLKLHASIIPSSLSKFITGAEALLSPHYYKINFKSSESTSSAWQPIQQYAPQIIDMKCESIVSDSLKFLCPEIIDKIQYLQPLQEIIQNNNNIKTVKSLDTNCINHNSVDQVSDDVNVQSVEDKTELKTCSVTAIVSFDSSMSQTINVPNTSFVLINEPNSNDFVLEGRANKNQKNSETEAVPLNNETKVEVKNPSIRIRRRIGLAPSIRRAQNKKSGILSTLSSLNANPLSSSVALGHRIEAEKSQQQTNILDYLLPVDRSSVNSIQKRLICLIGQFPYSPLATSIHFDHLASINPHFFNRIHFFVTSSSAPVSQLLSITPHLSVEKLRSYYWFSLSLQSNHPIRNTNDSTHQSSLHSTSTAIQLFNSSNDTLNNCKTIDHQHYYIPPFDCPLFKPFQYLISNKTISSCSGGVSRSLFIAVSDPVIADLASSLVCEDLRMKRILLMNQLRPLKKWLIQIEGKQNQWGAAIKQKIETIKSVFHEELNAQQNCDGNICRMRESCNDRVSEFCQSIIQGCPSFKVHTIVVLPYWNRQHEKDSKTAEHMHEETHEYMHEEQSDNQRTRRCVEVCNDLILMNKNWEDIRIALNELSKLQEATTLRCQSPIEMIQKIETDFKRENELETEFVNHNEKQNQLSIELSLKKNDEEYLEENLISSGKQGSEYQRLIVSVVPMEFLEDSYKHGRIDMNTLLKLRLSWNSIKERFYHQNLNEEFNSNNHRNKFDSNVNLDRNLMQSSASNCELYHDQSSRKRIRSPMIFNKSLEHRSKFICRSINCL